MFDQKLFEATLKEVLTPTKIEVSPEQLQQMSGFAQRIVEVNQNMNLTRILEPREMAIKNFFDSLTLLLLDLSGDLTVLDVGTGAGFPGIPLAITKPNWSFTLLDSLNKRLGFLEEIAQEFDLENVRTLHGRAEDVGQEPTQRESYDLVISRAVASLPTLLELCTPLVKPRGKFIAFKAGELEDELNQAQFAMVELNVELEQVFETQLPFEQGERNLLLFKKQASTPMKYPRRAGIPNKRPLM